MHSSKSRYTRAQLAHCGVLIEQSDNFYGIPGVEGLDDLFYGRFRDIIRTIFSSENSVSLCNDIIFGISESAPPDVVSFVNNWLLKSLPVIQSAPDDDTAFEMLIPRSVGSRAELAPYIERVSDYINSLENANTPDIES